MLHYTYRQCSDIPSVRWVALSIFDIRICRSPFAAHSVYVESNLRHEASALLRSADPTCTCNDLPSIDECHDVLPKIPANITNNKLIVECKLTNKSNINTRCGKYELSI